MMFGMCCVAAPLSALVLTQVDDRHAGVASGLNSAVSRLGSLITTALLSAVLAHGGEGLASGFRTAMFGGIALCGLAAFSTAFIRADLARNPV
jgi:hypothetical protein